MSIPWVLLRNGTSNPAAIAGLAVAVGVTGTLNARTRHRTSNSFLPRTRPTSCAEVVPASVAAVKESRDFAVFSRCRGDDNAYTAPIDSPPAETQMAQLLNAVANSDVQDPLARPQVVLLGEVHDDAVTHKVQFQVLEHCIATCKAQGRPLVLSLEMFEQDVQEVLNEYVLSRALREQDLLQDSRPWANYESDYRPLVELCREYGVPVVGANAPRRYVSLVSRDGCSGLQKLLQDRNRCSRSLPSMPTLPLPLASAAYTQKFIETMASQMAPSEGGGECPFIGFRADDVRAVKPEMLEAQLLWDHSMACSIVNTLQEYGPDTLVLHICGAFHCTHGLGIPEALPLYMGSGQIPKSAPALELSDKLWLPMDDVLRNSTSSDKDFVGPKQSPAGVMSVVCWPASVQATLAAVRDGQVLSSLGTMGDWVVVTEETWEESQTRADTPPSDGKRPTSGARIRRQHVPAHGN